MKSVTFFSLSVVSLLLPKRSALAPALVRLGIKTYATVSVTLTSHGTPNSIRM